MRFHETCALCTALNSFAAPEDYVASFVKQDRKVVNAARSHAVQPFPAIFCAPNQTIGRMPAMEITRYSGGSADDQIFAFTAARA